MIQRSVCLAFSLCAAMVSKEEVAKVMNDLQVGMEAQFDAAPAGYRQAQEYAANASAKADIFVNGE